MMSPNLSHGSNHLSSVCVVCAAVLSMLTAGAPAFAQATGPAVERLSLASRPASGDTYGADERITVHVAFSEPVTVTGEPRLMLQMGNQTRSTDLYRVTGNTLGFRYYVKASDHDDDGVGIPANAVLLNRGTIRDSHGNDAILTHEAIPDDPGRKVDGGLDALPTIERLTTGRPRQGDTFGGGESISVTLHFSEPVYVTGAPQLAIQVGTQARQMDLHWWGGGSQPFLNFAYVVQPSDSDADGFSVPADALTLNGGSIKDADGNDADLTHDAVPDRPGRKVDGASGAPSVVRVLLSRSPASADTYAVGETIFALAQFTRGVHVTGAPQFALQVGARARRANHLPRLRAAELLPLGNAFHDLGEDERNVYFQYVVQPSDVDDDGISAPANALTLNGGSIRAVGDDADARLNHDGLPDDPSRKVDGSLGDDEAPAVLFLTLEAPVRGVFGRADTVTLAVTLSEGVTLTGAPRFALRIGAQTRFATFRESWATTSLLFDYVVQESDRDDNGFSIDADAIDLNGATIRDNAGHDADLDLGYHAFSDDPSYKVDGRLTPVPALPLGGVLALLLALLVGGRRRLAR